MPNLQAKGKARPSYNRVQKREALMVLAHNNGNARAAQRDLERHEDRTLANVSYQTLHLWKKNEAEMYQECISHLDSMTIPEIDRNLRLNIQVGNAALERVLEMLPEMDAKDLSTVARNASVGMGIATEKSQLLKGNPTERVEVLEPTQILEELRRLAAQAVPRQIADVDGTAEEMDE
jgi:hypothetical protein